MAIALRSTASGQSASTSSPTFTVSKPTGVVDGDFLVAVYSLIASSVTSVMAAPAGWTMGTISVLGGTSTSDATVFCWKVASSEPSSYTFAGFNGGYGVATIMAFSGVDNTTPFAPDSGSNPATWLTTGGNVAAQTSPAVSPTTANAMVVYANVAEHNPAAATWTMPGGATTSAFQYTNSSAYFMQAAAYKQLTASGSTGTVSFSASGTKAGRWGGTLALNTASTTTPKSTTDAGSLDTQSASLSTSRSRTDAAALSTQTASLSTSRSRTDAGTLAESTSVNKKTGDLAALSESRGLSTSRSRTDAATVADSSVVTKRVGDSATLSNTATLAAASASADSGVLSDSTSVTKKTTDVVALTDSSGMAAAAPAMDAGTLGSLAGTAAAASTGDAAGLSELAELDKTRHLSGVDAGSVDDVAALSGASSGSDTAGLDDGSVLAAGTGVGDAGVLGELSEIQVTVFVDTDDTVGLAELSGTAVTASAGDDASFMDVATFGDGAVIQSDSFSLLSTVEVDVSGSSTDAGSLGEVSAASAQVPATDAVALGELASLDTTDSVSAEDAAELDEVSALTRLFGTGDDFGFGEGAEVAVLVSSDDTGGLDEASGADSSRGGVEDLVLHDAAQLVVLVGGSDDVSFTEVRARPHHPLVYRHRLLGLFAFVDRLSGGAPVVSGRLNGLTDQINATAAVSGRLVGAAAPALLSGSATEQRLDGSVVVEELHGAAQAHPLAGSVAVSGRLGGAWAADGLGGSAEYY